MKKSKFLLFVLIGGLLISCSEDQNNEPNENQEETSSHEEVEVEPVEDVKPALTDFIKGDWEKIAQGCDENGENCQDVGGSDWVFDGENVVLGRISQPYSISNDTIYIADSPYRIAMEMGDTILLNGIKHNRYLKLVRK